MNSSPGSHNLPVNNAFRRALEDHLGTLSHHEKVLFAGGTAEVALDLAKRCDDDHLLKSKSRRFAGVICGAVEGVKRYFHIIETAISSNPQIAAFVWGGLKFVIEIAAKYSDYFDKISSMLELIRVDLPYYHDYATKLYQNWSSVQDALSDVYGDILKLCTTAHRTFKQKDGRTRSHARIFLKAIKPFGDPFDPLIASFRNHRSILDRQAIHADRLDTQKEHRKAETERQAQTQERANTQDERIAGTREREWAECERKAQSLERSAAHHERYDAREARLREEARRYNQKFLHLLKPADCAVMHKQVMDKLSAGSAQWIFERMEFVNWASSHGPSGKILWCYGNAGAGKTCLVSSIIKKLEEGPISSKDNALAYFYFNFRESVFRDPHVLLRSILYQLLSHGRAYGVLAQLAARHAHVASLGSLDIDLLITETLTVFKCTFVIVDALDECDDPCAVLPGLLRLGSKVRLLVMSRDHEDIRRAFRDFSALHINSGALDEDISHYVRAEIETRLRDQRLRVGNEEIVDEITEALISKSDGMFLWVTLQLNHVCKQRSDHDILNALGDLPRGLEETYVRSLYQISSLGTISAARCRLALQWIIGARYALKLSELAEAVAIAEMEDGHWQPDRIVNDPRTIIDDCAGLCSLDSKSRVQLIHASVKDFLCSSKFADIPGALAVYQIHLPGLHLRLSNLCCKHRQLYLMDRIPSRQSITYLWPRNRPLEGGHRQPVFDWGAQNIPSAVWHAKSVGNMADLSDDELQELGSICTQLPLSTSHKHNREHDRLNLHPLVFASKISHNSGRLARVLVQRGVDISSADVDGFTPLHHAAKLGSLDVCSVLLECGANPNTRNKHEETPVHGVHNTPLIIPLLAQYGADMSAANADGGTPLHLGAAMRSTKICQVLLDCGADPNRSNRDGQTPLHIAASSWGYQSDTILKLLVTCGASLLAKNSMGWTPLHYAAHRADQNQTKILLEFGADVDAKDHLGRTPLHLACATDNADDQDHRKNTLALGLMLLLCGANPCITDIHGATPLHVFASSFCYASKDVNDPCLAMVASLSLMSLDALALLDRDNRTVEACLRRHAKKSNPRLGNLLLRIYRDGTRTPLGTPSQYPLQLFQKWCTHGMGMVWRYSDAEAGWDSGMVMSRRSLSYFTSTGIRPRTKSVPTSLGATERAHLHQKWLKDHKRPMLNGKPHQQIGTFLGSLSQVVTEGFPTADRLSSQVR